MQSIDWHRTSQTTRCRKISSNNKAHNVAAYRTHMPMNIAISVPVMVGNTLTEIPLFIFENRDYI